jgi:hypothetical protein
MHPQLTSAQFAGTTNWKNRRMTNSDVLRTSFARAAVLNSGLMTRLKVILFQNIGNVGLVKDFLFLTAKRNRLIGMSV